MKWIVALLVVVNAALYLWAGAGGDNEQFAPAKPDVNIDGMLLLSEIRPHRSPAQPAATTTTTTTTATTTATTTNQPQQAAIEPSGIDTKTARPPRAALSCYRIGPFKEEAGWLSANRWMAARQFAYQAVRSERRAMRAVRVYLGPFDSPAAARPMMKWLKERRIEHFAGIDSGGGSAEGKVRLSLGYFIQEELAAKFIAHLVSQGVEAHSRDEYQIIGPFDWMEASIDSARRDLLLSRDWREKGVAIIEVDCGEISLPKTG